MNPFVWAGDRIRPKKNRAATLQDLNAFVAAADADGSASLGTAAMIAYWWLPAKRTSFSAFLDGLSSGQQSRPCFGLASQKPKDREGARSILRCGWNIALAGDGRAVGHRRLVPER